MCHKLEIKEIFPSNTRNASSLLLCSLNSWHYLIYQVYRKDLLHESMQKLAWSSAYEIRCEWKFPFTKIKLIFAKIISGSLRHFLIENIFLTKKKWESLSAK